MQLKKIKKNEDQYPNIPNQENYPENLNVKH